MKYEQMNILRHLMTKDKWLQVGGGCAPSP